MNTVEQSIKERENSRSPASSNRSPQFGLLSSDQFQWWKVENYLPTNRNYDGLVFYSAMPCSFGSFRMPRGTAKVFLRMVGLEKDCRWCGFNDKYEKWHVLLTHSWLYPEHINIFYTSRKFPHWKSLFQSICWYHPSCQWLLGTKAGNTALWQSLPHPLLAPQPRSGTESCTV